MLFPRLPPPFLRKQESRAANDYKQAAIYNPGKQTERECLAKREKTTTIP